MEHYYTLSTENPIPTEELPSENLIASLLSYSQAMEIITLPNGESVIVINN